MEQMVNQPQWQLPYQALADAILVLHLLIVLFVVLGLPIILLGNKAGWRWVNSLPWRVAHLVAIAIVVLQAWLGQYCVLTVLESFLRAQAGQQGYEASFIQYLVQRLLYYDAPLWLFAIIYTGFALLVIWAWWRYPPTTGNNKHASQ